MSDDYLDVTTSDGAFRALMVRPGVSSGPAILVVQEIFGINHTLRRIADALAGMGYLAIVPDLFWRFQPGIVLDDRVPEQAARAFELFPKFDVDRGVEDIAATLEAVRRLPECDGRVGVVGYCLGGLLAFLTATRTDADATVSYYGVSIDKFTAEAERLAHPLLLHVAGEDKFVPAEAQAKIIADLKNHPQVEIHAYPGRDHAFAREGGEMFDRHDAGVANDRTMAFFSRTLR